MAFELMGHLPMQSVRTIRLLVVEDNPGFQYLIQQAFGDRGEQIRWELTVANDGEEALRLLFEEEDENIPLPDLILLDWNLPKVTGSEVLRRVKMQSQIRSVKHGCVINGYGPPENTTFTCRYRVTRDTEIGDSVPIGTPIANTSVYILDSNLRPVGIGEVGEIFIGGDGLALARVVDRLRRCELVVLYPDAGENAARRVEQSAGVIQAQRTGRIEVHDRFRRPSGSASPNSDEFSVGREAPGRVGPWPRIPYPALER